METTIKLANRHNLLSELILDILENFCRNKMSRINSPKQLTSFDYAQDVILSGIEGLRSLSFRKLWAH